MWLKKFCDADHLPSISGKLRLGTLHEYRKIERPELRDPKEGTHEWVIDFHTGVRADIKWLSEISLGAINSPPFGQLSTQAIVGTTITVDLGDYGIRGTLSVYIDQLHISEENGNDFTATGLLKFHFSRHNSMILCMSWVDDPSAHLFEDYNSSWSIELKKRDEFAGWMCRHINQHMSLLQFDERSLNLLSLGQSSAIRVTCSNNPVEYRDRKIEVKNRTDLNREMIVSLLRNAEFVKDRKFEAEQEYRFVFDFDAPSNRGGNQRTRLDTRESPYFLPISTFGTSFSPTFSRKNNEE
ncbi:hypothetical protein AB0T83_00130 [Fluviibacterium sp. DFM31]|uniref:Uncharacterized protein n=1 Tax=Meridianimarinicoccus marinus TaxID=3231483 RepID=A0ABV3L0U7_9RHOB